MQEVIDYMATYGVGTGAGAGSGHYVQPGYSSVFYNRKYHQKSYHTDNHRLGLLSQPPNLRVSIVVPPADQTSNPTHLQVYNTPQSTHINSPDS